jgi:hypothetical protein
MTWQSHHALLTPTPPSCFATAPGRCISATGAGLSACRTTNAGASRTFLCRYGIDTGWSCDDAASKHSIDRIPRAQVAWIGTGRVTRVTRRLRILLVSILGVLLLYSAVFAFWWLRSPSRIEAYQSKQVRIVEFQFNAISCRTEPVWSPAFWFVEQVLGYERSGFAAMHDQSIQMYAK